MIDRIIDLWNYHRDTVFSIGLKILFSAIVILIGLFISKGLSKLIRRASSTKSIDPTVCSILRHIVTYAVFIICAIMVLNIFGVNTASLLALLGAAGLAIGLALRDTLGNIASGITLFFIGSIRIGEFVEFGSVSGTVKEINLFTTILETPDGLYISAPNSCIWGNSLKNYTRNGKRRMEISVCISFSDSIDTAFGVLKDIAASEPKFLQEPPPQVIVQSLQDSSVKLCLRAWTSVDDYWDVYWKHMRMVKEKIEEAGITIPFPIVQVTGNRDQGSGSREPQPPTPEPYYEPL